MLWRLQQSIQAENMERIVVAIDFGTSRTAFATTQENSEQDDMQIGVPEGAGHVSLHDAKTPTNILLSPSDHSVMSFGYKAEEDYMDPMGNNALFFRWFKMGLFQASSNEPMVKAANGKAVKLSVVWEKSLQHVMRDVMSKMKCGKGVCITASEIIWVLTVPAIWNDWAKSVMRKAAYDAGMIREIYSENLVFALEPECACLSMQNDKALGLFLEAGQKILIIDCGGGTVDITAHEITSIQPFKIKELIPPNGGPLGATKVDDRFFEFFSDLVGASSFERLRRAPTFLSLTRSWEDRKVTFTGKETDEQESYCSISVGDVLLELDISKTKWPQLVSRWNLSHPKKPATVRGKAGLGLSHNLMMSFFQEPIRQIVLKVENVIRENRRALIGLRSIVLAGGFARCPILVDCIRDNFENTGARVFVSQHPDLAIVRGAAAFGARKNIFQSRKAKYTYGISASITFNSYDIQHLAHEDKKYKASDGKYRLDVFSVHGRIGDDIGTETDPYRGDYQPLIENQEKMHFAVLVTKSWKVFLDNEEGVQELCKCSLPVDMSLPYRDRNFQVEFSFAGTETTCKIYRFTGSGYIHVKDMNVIFPCEVHWLSRDFSKP